MLVSCGGRSRTKTSRASDRGAQRKRKFSNTESLFTPTGESVHIPIDGWEYVAEGGANAVFRHKDVNGSVLRVPKWDGDKPIADHNKIFEYIKNSVLPTMNNRDVYVENEDAIMNGKEVELDFTCDRIGDYYCTRSRDGETEEDWRYRLYGTSMYRSSFELHSHLDEILAKADRPEHRRSSRLVRWGYTNEPVWVMLLPNVVADGEVCIELKPKSSLGPIITTNEKRYDGMTMKQRICRYCMHQEWKVLEGSIPTTRSTEKYYCPMDLFSNDKGRMKKAILALMDDPQNNFKVFRPDGNDITTEVVATTKSASAAIAFKDITGMLQDELVCVIVDGLCESRVLDDLRRAHELDELDIEGIWHLHRVIESYDNIKDNRMCNLGSDSSDSSDSEQQEELDPQTLRWLDMMDNNSAPTQWKQKEVPGPQTRRWLSEIGWEKEDSWKYIRGLYRNALSKFLLATTMKDCSILMSIRSEGSSKEVNMQNGEIWREMEYEIECEGKIYHVLISLIDLDTKSDKKLSKYHKLDQDIVNHYSGLHGLHNKFCFGPCLSEDHEDEDSVVQIKGNMMCRLLYPNPVCLLTVYDPTKHTANVMTITWLTAIDNHGTFVCSIAKTRHTAKLLREFSVFVLNVPTRDLEETILKIGSISGGETDKFRELGLRTCIPGWTSNAHTTSKRKKTQDNHYLTKHAIALKDCIAHTICIVQQKQDFNMHWLLICKQEMAWSKKDYFADGKRFIRSSESLPPYLTFLGTKTFGSVV